jgi:hypothetical protein
MTLIHVKGQALARLSHANAPRCRSDRGACLSPRSVLFKPPDNALQAEGQVGQRRAFLRPGEREAGRTRNRSEVVTLSLSLGTDSIFCEFTVHAQHTTGRDR